MNAEAKTAQAHKTIADYYYWEAARAKADEHEQEDPW
jgi:hypothetical protein